MKQAIVGVLGGMGPEATVRLFGLLVAATPAQRDQDHLRILIDDNSKVPDRNAAILGHGEDPLPYLEESARLLQQAGADFLVIPCNTAHHWLGPLRARVSLPILDMVGAVAAAVSAVRPRLSQVGLLTSIGAREAGLYPTALLQHGVATLDTNSDEQSALMNVIYRIKAADQGVRDDVIQIARRLLARGAEGLILGCTELSLVGEMRELGCPLFDPLAIVAQRAVEIASNWDRGRADLESQQIRTG